MIILVVIASVLIALITIYQYNEQADDYHKGRLERKESTIKTSIYIELQRRTTYPVEERYLRLIFKDKVYDVSEINQLDINVYDLNGKLQASSSSSFTKDSTNYDIPNDILIEIAIMKIIELLKKKQ